MTYLTLTLLNLIAREDREEEIELMNRYDWMEYLDFHDDDGYDFSDLDDEPFDVSDGKPGFGWIEDEG